MAAFLVYTILNFNSKAVNFSFIRDLFSVTVIYYIIQKEGNTVLLTQIIIVVVVL